MRNADSRRGSVGANSELLRLQQALQAETAERKRLEELLRQQRDEFAAAGRRKDEFLAMLAHELRNPLAPIQNALHIMRQVGVSGPVAERARDMVDRQVHHLSRLVDDLLDVSRLTRGEIKLQKQRVLLSTIVQRAVEAVHADVESRGHELTLTLPEHRIFLDADPARLEQVLSNLLGNAAKYTQPGGRIWLTVRQRQHEIVLQVRDNGMGIDPDFLPHIFEPFVQADHSLERLHGGLGVGLTLVQRLVELHGGTVAAASAGLGRGSEFVLRLPALVEPEVDEVPQFSEAARNGRLLQVLVVDDNRDAARSLGTILRLWGHEVTIAYDGPTAVEACRNQRPDVVLLDIGIPGADGYAVARQLREEQGTAPQLLIALTGYSQDEARRRSREAGFDYHLVKPVDPEQLQRLLRASLESTGAAGSPDLQASGDPAG